MDEWHKGFLVGIVVGQVLMVLVVAVVQVLPN